MVLNSRFGRHDKELAQKRERYTHDLQRSTYQDFQIQCRADVGNVKEIIGLFATHIRDIRVGWELHLSKARLAALASAGVTVLRFTNDEVLRDMRSVIERLEGWIETREATVKETCCPPS